MTTQLNKTQNQNRRVKLARALKTIGIAFGLSGLLISSANAQTRSLTLNEAIKLGLQNSKTLKLSQTKIDEAVSEYNQAKDRYLPTGNASFAFNRAEIPANSLDLGPKSTFNLPKNDNAYLGIVSLSEPILAGGKLRYARESTTLLTQVARLDADKDKDQITYDIVSSYYNLYKVLQSQKVVAQNIATIDEQIHQSERFLQEGLVTKNDVLRFQLQKSNIQLNGIDLESNRKIINFSLDVLLGLPETTELTIDQVNDINKDISPLSFYIDTALANRQEVKQMDLRTRVAETNIKNVRADQLPTLAATVAAYYVDINVDPFPKGGNYITPLTAGLTLSWKFSSLWTNKNRVSEAKIQRDESLVNKSIIIDNVKNDVNQSYQNYVTAINKIQLLQTSIEQAGENNKILQSKYKSNISSATDRADAQTLLYQAQINLELAKADAGLAYYTLLKSTGKLSK